MTHPWSRRFALGLAASACVLLVSCGGGSTVSSVKNVNRAIAVGDGFQDVGQIGGTEYTVNDGSGIWLQSLASDYGLSLTPANSGGWGYAQGYAQVATAVTDPNGHAVPSVSDQITALLARTTLGPNDLVFINGGMSDIVAAVKATGISAATTATVKAAADALASQVQRLVDAGATHVVVTGVYDLGTTPWAASVQGTTGVGTPISALSTAFNVELLTQINHFSKLSVNPVLYFEAAEFFDFAYNSVAQGTTSNGNFGVTNVTTPVCTTPTAATCTTSTLRDPNYNAYLFADNLYFTPNVQHLFVNTSYAANVLSLIQNVWGTN
jgi:phospholipase/lecithinase/hemolysin